MAEQDKSRRMQDVLHEKLDKEVSQVKHQLNHERTLKLDAFQRVDDLQTCVGVGQQTKCGTKLYFYLC